ncbi:hypothetical protein [Nonomuraea sp. NPDC001023]|uniref:hypothetical protein n=1 Tax=unclassified Nonomuraea TaxID=2593643 RepID=UPI00331EB781
MRIRRLPSAVVAVALGVSVLAGTAPASATTSATATARTGAAGWPAPDWYLRGPYQTLADCDAGFDNAADSGLYTALAGCHWFRGGGLWAPGYYFEVYLP